MLSTTILECFIIGTITMIFINIIYKSNIIDKKKKYYKMNLIIGFIFSFILHYMIESNKITELYCKKVCYNDECFLVCKV